MAIEVKTPVSYRSACHFDSRTKLPGFISDKRDSEGQAEYVAPHATTLMGIVRGHYRETGYTSAIQGEGILRSANENRLCFTFAF